MSNPYDSPRLAAAYACDRPPVHAAILAIIAGDLGLAVPLARALDIGCGAGLSTAGLAELAERVAGVDRSPTMLKHGRGVAGRAGFVAAVAEQLPFAAATFDLITAAGSLNYADLQPALCEAARVLTPEGTLAIYDFSWGQRTRQESGLEPWCRELEGRYPEPPGYELDVRTLDYQSCGLRLAGYREIEVPLEMSQESYLPYVLSETRIERAIAGGIPDREIREWCRRTLATVFAGRPLDVLFDGYVAYVSLR